MVQWFICMRIRLGYFVFAHSAAVPKIRKIINANYARLVRGNEIAI